MFVMEIFHMATEWVKRTIILPTVDNDGRSLKTEIESCETDLLLIAKGFTSYDVTGQWRNEDGHVFTDSSRVYFVTVEDGAERVPCVVSSATSGCALHRCSERQRDVRNFVRWDSVMQNRLSGVIVYYEFSVYENGDYDVSKT